jgi:hypothetical protein
MRMLKCLAAAGAIAALLQTANACDDFDEEMALAAARDAARLAEAQPRPEAPAPATSVASTEPPYETVLNARRTAVASDSRR